MCGIVGFIGNAPAAPILLQALKRLEYRGYDSAGMCTFHQGKLHLKKDQGKIDEIEGRLKLSSLPGCVGLGHTRWATHGEPSSRNAHPHLDSKGRVAVVHNGIIENYTELREFLERKGFSFGSETDTEVIPNLISYYISRGKNLIDAIRLACSRLKGSYALGIFYVGKPDLLVGVRKESPLIIGLGRKAMFLASDIPALLPFTRKVIVLQDYEMALLSANGCRILSLKTGKVISREPTRVKWTLEMAEKMGYPHFMLKEIYEQPSALQQTLRSDLKSLSKLSELMLKARKVYLVGCGTSYHACLLGKYFLSKLAGLSPEVVISSEFQESCRVDKRDLVLAVTQSGETADTLKAIRIAKKWNAKTVSLVNVVGSTITRETDLTCYIHAGPEISVVATKTFTSQLAFLLRLALHMSSAELDLSPLPKLMESVLKKVDSKMERLAEALRGARDVYLIGRGIAYPVALEGALKLKEVSYVHAEAMAGGELKHGTLALIEKGTPVIALIPPGEPGVRMLSNVEEVRSRGANVLTVASSKVPGASCVALPKTDELFFPFLAVLPLQLFAYHMAVKRGCDPDKPRHLAKSVTVE